MIVRMGLLQKRPDLTTAEFRDYWRTGHARVAEGLPGLRRYEQNHVVDARQRGIDHKRGQRDYDGFSQLWFDSLEAMAEAIDGQGPALAADEQAFIGDLDIVVAEPTAVVPEPVARPAVKRMSTLKRRADLEPAEFTNEWRRHADLVAEMPGVLGYVQHHVVGRNKDKGRKSMMLDAAYDEVPIDGVVELWFDDVGAVDRAFASPQGRATMEHAAAFIDEINVYLVDPVRIR